MISACGSHSLGLTSYQGCSVLFFAKMFYSLSVSLYQTFKFNVCVGGVRGLIKVEMVKGWHTRED